MSSYSIIYILPLTTALLLFLLLLAWKISATGTLQAAHII